MRLKNINRKEREVDAKFRKVAVLCGPCEFFALFAVNAFTQINGIIVTTNDVPDRKTRNRFEG